MKVVREFINLSNGQVHLRRAGCLGDHTPIVCLHMIPKSSKGFAKLIPKLADDTLVLAPDYPGYGESDAYPLGDLPTISNYADTVVELIKQLGLNRVNLLGYHTGSMVAVEIATRFPDMIEKIVCIAAPVLSVEESEQLKAYFTPIPLDKAGTRYTTMWSRVLQFCGPGMTLEMAAESMAENLRGGERYEEGHAAAFNYAPEFVEKLSNLRHQLLVMNIGDDLYQQTKPIAEFINNGRYQEFREWGHGFLELTPGDVADVLKVFFTEPD